MISKDLDVKELARLGSERRLQEKEDMSSPSQRRSSTLMKIEFRSFQDALVEKGGTDKLMSRRGAENHYTTNPVP